MVKQEAAPQNQSTLASWFRGDCCAKLETHACIMSSHHLNQKWLGSKTNEMYVSLKMARICKYNCKCAIKTTQFDLVDSIFFIRFVSVWVSHLLPIPQKNCQKQILNRCCCEQAEQKEMAWHALGKTADRSKIHLQNILRPKPPNTKPLKNRNGCLAKTLRYKHFRPNFGSRKGLHLSTPHQNDSSFESDELGGIDSLDNAFF